MTKAALKRLLMALALVATLTSCVNQQATPAQEEAMDEYIDKVKERQQERDYSTPDSTRTERRDAPPMPRHQQQPTPTAPSHGTVNSESWNDNSDNEVPRFKDNEADDRWD